ncbi:Transposase IS66 family protein [Oceanobacillus oncorhynchi]|uniref:Transposase IS66 family protein n=2 Tax=Oceanobacillus oncorhynchi TaxID=545501 RepID=A0A0A1MP94_9BACI|nr:IS66 family transposase [Oceanobacillus oncorhynchi]CEI80886.1 Transposase IS66 family protein [Oceanobacillus oncorhynchi]CEI82101.1 Transposase IS66 family protein [Oceanobacillus oncorhynchi]
MTELEKKLMKQIEHLTIQNEKQAKQIEQLINQLTNMNRRLFGTSSEKNPQGQLSFFEEDNNSPFSEAEQPADKAVEIETISYQRKKYQGQRADITRDLPIVVEEHTLPSDSQVCSCCASPLKHLGKREARTELEFIPAHLVKHVHYEHAYECLACKKTGQNHILRQKAPEPALAKSLAGPSVLACNLYQKLEMSIPYHRQEKEWARYGLKVSRRTLANWAIRSSEEWLEPLYQQMREKLLLEPVLSADETTYQILRRADEKSATADARIWLFRTAEAAEHPIILYHSSETRRFEVAETFLKGFQGLLHCDGYSVYQKLEDVQLQTCWAHVRRKFLETNDSNGQGAVGVHYCDQLFKLERQWKDLSPEERLQQRQLESKPLLKEFWGWLDALVTMKGPLQKAVDYTQKLRDSLQRFLTDGRLFISNNLAERSIRPVTVGRKNWYFSTSVAGAHANTIGYSVIQTAKENGIDPFEYLTVLFTELPQLNIFQDSEQWENYFPWSPYIQAKVKPLSKHIKQA